MAEENINIRIREDGAVVVKRRLEDIGDTSIKSAGGVDLLTKALGALAAFVTADKIMQYADAWTTASGMIANATKNTREATAVQERLFAAAQKTGSSYSAMVEMYARVQRGAKDMGKSQEDALQFAEGVGKALRVQGVSATAAQGALLQLGQALSSNKIQAEEYNSLLDATPALLQVVANNLEGASGSVGRLTQLVKAGKVTNTQFFEAFMKGQDELQKQFEKSGASFSSAFQKLENAAIKFFGKLNEGSGAAVAFDKVVTFIANHFDQLIGILASVGVAIAVAFTPTVIVAFTNALRAMTAAALANPFTAIAAAVLALISYVAIFGDEISAGIDETTSLLDLFRGAMDVGSDFFGGLADVAGEAWDYITMASSDGTSAMFNDVQVSTEKSSQSYNNFFEGVGTGWLGAVKATARATDLMIGLVLGFNIAIIKVFSGLPQLFANVFTRAYNASVDALGGITNLAINGINKIRQAAGVDPIELVKFDKKQVGGMSPEEYGKSIVNGVKQGIDLQGGVLEKTVDKWIAASVKRGKERAAKGKDSPVDLTDPIGKRLAAMDDDKKGKKKQDDLAKAAEKRANALAKVNLELDNELSRMYLLKPQREVQEKFDQISQQLASSGIKLTQQESSSIRSKIEAIQQASYVQQQYDDTYESSVAAQRDYNASLKAAQMLLNAGVISQAKYNAEVERANIIYNERVNPIADFNKQSMDQLLVLEKVGVAARAEAQVQQQRNDAIRAGLPFTEEQADIIRQTVDLLEIETIKSQARNAVWDETVGKQRTINAEMQAYNQMLETGMLTAEQYSIKLQQLAVQQANLNMQVGSQNPMDALTAGLGDYVTNFDGIMAGLSDSWGQFFTSFSDGVANSIGQAIVYGDDLGESLKNVAKQALSQLIASLVKLGIQYIVNAALANSAMASTAAVSATTAATTAAAWAPAAAAVSLASYGANAVPANIGIISTYGLTEALSAFSGAVGFQTGGWTGNGAVDQVAGFVHGKEFVMNAQATKRIGVDNLTALMNGTMQPSQVAATTNTTNSSTMRQGISVQIINQGTSKDFEVEQLSEQEIRIIARDEANNVVRQKAPSVIAADIANANGEVSTSMGKNTRTERQR